MEEADTTYEESAFDMSFSTLGRINYLLWKANTAQDTDNVDAWVKTLRVLFKETSTSMTATQLEDNIKKYEEEIIPEYKKYINYISQHSFNVRIDPDIRFQPPKRIFDLLFNWEIELRTILDKKGLLMKRGDRADRAMI